jgi:hypothetical protein
MTGAVPTNRRQRHWQRPLQSRPSPQNKLFHAMPGRDLDPYRHTISSDPNRHAASWKTGQVLRCRVVHYKVSELDLTAQVIHSIGRCYH